MRARQQVHLHDGAELLADPRPGPALGLTQLGVDPPPGLVTQPGDRQPLQPGAGPLGRRRPGGPEGRRRDR
jgi:hypothetical protein